MYLNNAANGFDDEELHKTVVELALTTSALFCVANPVKLNGSELFQHFAVEHVSRHMFRYKDCSDMYLFTCISGQLKTMADGFATIFQSEIQKRTSILNNQLTATQMLAMSCSIFKDLNYDEVVVDCAMLTLARMQFDTLSLEDAEYNLFCSATQYLRKFLESRGQSFTLKLAIEKNHLSVYGKLKFLNAVVKIFQSKSYSRNYSEMIKIVFFTGFLFMFIKPYF